MTVILPILCVKNGRNVHQQLGWKVEKCAVIRGWGGRELFVASSVVCMTENE